MSLYKQEFGQDFDLGFDLKEQLLSKAQHHYVGSEFLFCS